MKKKIKIYNKKHPDFPNGIWGNPVYKTKNGLPSMLIWSDKDYKKSPQSIKIL